MLGGVKYFDGWKWWKISSEIRGFEKFFSVRQTDLYIWRLVYFCSCVCVYVYVQEKTQKTKGEILLRKQNIIVIELMSNKKYSSQSGLFALDSNEFSSWDFACVRFRQYHYSFAAHIFWHAHWLRNYRVCHLKTSYRMIIVMCAASRYFFFFFNSWFFVCHTIMGFWHFCAI